MPITAAMRKEIAQLYVVVLGAAPDGSGFQFWLDQYEQGAPLLQLAGQFLASPNYLTGLTNQEFVVALYANVVHQEGGEGIDFWTTALDGGTSRVSIILNWISAISNYAGADPGAIEMKTLLDNKVNVAVAYGSAFGSSALAQQVLSGVTSDIATVTEATAAIAAGTVASLGIPLIASASYDAATGVLTVTGSGFLDKLGGGNDIVASKLSLAGEGGQYTFTDSSNVEITSRTSFTLTLSATDKAAVAQIFNSNGLASTSGVTYNLAAADDWDAGALASLAIADTTAGVNVSNVPVPVITSATYDAMTGALVVTGSGFLGLSGAANDIDVQKLSIVGQGGASYRLTTGNVDITSATAFTVMLNLADRAALRPVINLNGSVSQDVRSYALVADENWAAGAAAAVVVADPTGNGITASGVDSTPPTATIGMSDTTLGIGDTSAVTITFSEAVTGFSNAGLAIPNGTLTLVGSVDGGITWTATLTPTAGVTAAANRITLDNTGVTDASGNAGTGITQSNNYAVDTVAPTLAITSSVPAVRTGQTATITFAFSEAPLGFDDSDIVTSGGALSTLVATADPLVYTATFTPTPATASGSASITVAAAAYGDGAGNAGGAGATPALAIDTLAPTATVVVSDTALGAGETSAVTITFNEAVTGFSNAGLSVPNGTLSLVGSGDGGITWTATLTPTAGVTEATNLITLDYTGVTDAAGNAGTGTTPSNNYAVDTVAPTLAITSSAPAVRTGQTATITFTFSEAPVDFIDSDIVTSGGALSTLVATADPLVYTATFTPTPATASGSASITVAAAAYSDGTSNAGGAGATPALAIDTLAPVFTSAVVNRNSMVLTYAEFTTLDGLHVATPAAFTVVSGGAPNAVTAVLVNGANKTVTLTLAGVVSHNQAVTVAYADPTPGDDANAIQDAAGNDAASIARALVTNSTAEIPNTPGSGLTIKSNAPADRPLQQGDTLTVLPLTLVDPDGVGAIEYQWLRNGSPVAGANGSSYLLTADDVGARIIAVASYTDALNVQERVLSPVTLLVADNDGVASAVEARAPRLLPGGLVGDGNGDGLLDELQGSVVSAPLPGEAEYLTLVAQGTHSVISQFHLDTAAPDLQDLNMAGHVHFNVDVAATGQSEAFQAFVGAGSHATGYWLQDRSGAWSNVATGVEAVGESLRIDFAITDGGQFDLDGLANGAIESIGGVASAPLGLIGLPPDLATPGAFWF